MALFSSYLNYVCCVKNSFKCFSISFSGFYLTNNTFYCVACIDAFNNDSVTYICLNLAKMQAHLNDEAKKNFSKPPI